ncbi:MAG: tetratricopeptide repeat protein [Pirellulales bacterium]|nr:tetratricopeptide repeat protein [Pirellulales bacterium]
MQRLGSFRLLGAVCAGVLLLAVPVAVYWFAPDPAAEILASFREDSPYGGLAIEYPLGETLFPPEIVPPKFRWHNENTGANTWLVLLRFADGLEPIHALCDEPCWTPSPGEWKAIKQRSLGGTARVFVLGVRRDAPGEILCGAAISIGTSTDEVAAPLFYREVILPFIDAVKDPSRIRWRLGEISSAERPPVVLERLPVCGNCHSFSADGAVLGMDVDYANSKGSYAILPVQKEMLIPTSNIITWDDYQKKEGELSFGLLSQVSPDGKCVVSTVKDRSVFVPRPDLAFSQLFFPIKGLLAYYCRDTKTFHVLPGADDPSFVHSNPSWSPDGKYLVFARSRAYQLKHLGDKKAVLLTADECREFLDEKQTFRYDLYRIPFNQGQGGRAEPLAGASQNDMSNYFGRYSPDGKWIVFCRAKSFMLLQPDSELYIIPAAGGEARRLRCNTSRMNSWHSWSPNGRWLVFSSKANSAYTQLFLTHIDPQGVSTPAVLLSQFTADDRAANIPEFVPFGPHSIERIREEFLDDHSFIRAGNEYLRHDDLDGAMEAYGKALELNPKSAEALCNLGICLSTKGMLDQAESHIGRAVALRPEDQDMQLNLGMVLARQGRCQEAVTRFRKAVQIDPRFVKAHVNLAAALAKLGRNDQVIETYRTVLSIQPEYAHAHFELGRALLRGNQVTEAARHFAATIEIDPKGPGAYYYLGQILLQNGRAADAAKCLKQAVELDPNGVAALNALAWVYATCPESSLRDGARAVALADHACRLSEGKLPAVLDTLAAAYAESGDFQKAARTAAEAQALANHAGNRSMAAEIGNHLALYLEKRPLRQARPGLSGAVNW